MRYLPLVALSGWLGVLTFGAIRLDLINPPGIAVMYGCAVFGALTVMVWGESR